MDSATLLAEAVSTGDEVRPVGFDYGQRHSRELLNAAQLAEHYGCPFRVVGLSRLRSPALTDGAQVPHGHYAADTMTATVVQGRNLLFVAQLVGLAQPQDEVWVGVHAGDHAIYADCRPAFVEPLAAAVQHGYGVTLRAPFLTMTKAQIAQRGGVLDVPYGLTWSCYEGGESHCGRCGTCVERAEAFHLAGVDDPTHYADPGYWRTQVEA
jgi:7-cyano-7-deazaguanine synthase